MCIFILNMKFVSLILCLGICTDTDTGVNADDNYYAGQANHDYMGLFGIVPNEPKSTKSI